MSIEVRSNYQLPIFIALYCKGIVNVELFPDDFDKRIIQIYPFPVFILDLHQYLPI